MTKEEFLIFAAAMKTYYPRENILPNKQAMELWHKQLEDIPYKVLETALNQWIATEKWSPCIADLREKAALLMGGQESDWGKAWESVLTAIRRFGRYRPMEAVESLDEITRECVERLGFMNLCNSDNINVDRGNFRMIYETLAERKKRDEQTPKAILELGAMIRQKMLDNKNNQEG